MPQCCLSTPSPQSRLHNSLREMSLEQGCRLALNQLLG